MISNKFWFPSLQGDKWNLTIASNNKCLAQHNKPPVISFQCASSHRRMHKGRDRLFTALSGMPLLHGYESHFSVNSLFVLSTAPHWPTRTPKSSTSSSGAQNQDSVVSTIFLSCMAGNDHTAVLRTLFVPFCIVVVTENSLLLLWYSWASVCCPCGSSLLFCCTRG